MKTREKRFLITEALALNLGYHVDGKTGTVDGVDLHGARAEITVNDAAPTRRVGLGAAAGVAGVASFGLAAAPLALLGLKKKDNRSVTVRLVATDVNMSTLIDVTTEPRTFTGKQMAQAIRFAGRVNAQK